MMQRTGFDPRKFGIECIETREGLIPINLKKTDSTSGRPGVTILTEQQRTGIAKGIINEEFTGSEVARALDLDRKTPGNWVRALRSLLDHGYENPQLPSSSLGGAPLTINETVGKKFEEQIAKRHKKNNCLTAGSTEATSLFMEAYVDTCGSRGAPGLKTAFDPRTIKTTHKRLGIGDNKGRKISQARVQAVDDPRNALTHALAMDVHCKGKPDCFKGNFDFVQFMGIAQDNGDSQVLIAKSNGNDIEARSTKSSETCIFVKYLSIFITNGLAASPIFVVANENVDPDKPVIAKVPLMSHSDEPSSFGYLFWSKTRSFNAKNFVWMWKTVIFPMIDSIRSSYGFDITCTDDDEIRKCTFTFIQDGEAQGVEATQDHDIINVCKEKFIDLLKSAHSCSLTQQLCDLAEVYRGSKHDLKVIQANDYKNEALKRHLQKAIADNNEVLNYSSAEKAKLITILLKITAVLKRHVTHKAIVTAAGKAGMIGDEATWDKVTRKIPFDKCTHDWKGHEFKKINDNWETLKRIWEEKGQLPDRDLDELGIVRGTHETHQQNREDLVVWRQRTTWLNHDHMIEGIQTRNETKRQEEQRKVESKALKERQAASKLLTDPLLAELKQLVDSSKMRIKEIGSHADKCREFHISSKKEKAHTIQKGQQLREETEQLHLRSKELGKSIMAKHHEATDEAKEMNANNVSRLVQEVKRLHEQLMEIKLDAAEKEDATRVQTPPPLPAAVQVEAQQPRRKRGRSKQTPHDELENIPLINVATLTPAQKRALLDALQQE